MVITVHHTGTIQFNIFFGGARGSSLQPIHLDELRCTGTEESLLNCTHSGIGVNDCEHPEDVGIICQSSTGKVMVYVVVIVFNYYYVNRLYGR